MQQVLNMKHLSNCSTFVDNFDNEPKKKKNKTTMTVYRDLFILPWKTFVSVFSLEIHTESYFLHSLITIFSLWKEHLHINTTGRLQMYYDLKRKEVCDEFKCHDLHSSHFFKELSTGSTFVWQSLVMNKSNPCLALTQSWSTF